MPEIPATPTPRSVLGRRQLFRLGGLAALGAAVPGLAACNNSITGGDGETGGSQHGGSSAGPAQLQFMFWGSTFEQKAISAMLTDFQSDHRGTTVKPLFTPGTDYDTKINTLVASNRAPDLAYLGAPLAYRLAENGKLVNLFDYFDKYPELTQRLPGTYFWYGQDKCLGTQTANEMFVLWYNKQVFADAGVAVPPAEAANAWSWDQFVQNATALTLDQNGHRPDEAGFDPTKIRQFGCSMGLGTSQIQAMLASRGMSLFDEAGKRCLLDTPEAIEVVQNIQDLAYQHHVAPTFTQAGGSNAPTTTVQLQTKRIAMAVDGQWTLLDLGSSKLDYGLGVLPKYDKPMTVSLGGATVVFASTKSAEAAIELYLYHNDPGKVKLFSDGLWMPLGKSFYTDDAAIKSWTDNQVHPPEYRTAAVDYTVNNSVPAFDQSMKNMDAMSQVITPALQPISQGKQSAASVLKPLAQKLNAMAQGAYPRQSL